jgi:hypothetical protein
MICSGVQWCGTAACAAQGGAAPDRALDRLQADNSNDVATWAWGRAHVAISALWSLQMLRVVLTPELTLRP